MAFRYLILCWLCLAPLAVADDASQITSEIDHLIAAIGASGCTFVRNGKEHSAAEAESHIRSKYRRGKRYAKTTEAFIERLASQSSMSKKPYWMMCPGSEPIQSGDWLRAELAAYRSVSPSP